MKAIAVTGGIASGKSTVCAMFAELGAIVRSADQDARAVLSAGSPTLDAVREAFPGAWDSDAGLNRASLASIIFADPDARVRLNAIMHPAIRARMRAAIDAARADLSPGLLIYEVPLLYEGGLETWFDSVVAVLATSQDQSQRLQAREVIAGRAVLADSAITERLASQMPPEEKARRADYVVRTDGTLETTRGEVARVMKQLLERQTAEIAP